MKIKNVSQAKTRFVLGGVIYDLAPDAEATVNDIYASEAEALVESNQSLFTLDFSGSGGGGSAAWGGITGTLNNQSDLSNALNAKATSVVPTVSQKVYVNFLSGSDTTGNGSYGKPFKSAAKAMDSITDAQSSKPYTIALQSARQIETGDFLWKPYVFIAGDMQRATYFRVNSGQIKPHASHASANSWVGLKNLYLGGGTQIN